MHQWNDDGIILTITRYGEQSAVVRVLTAEHGIYPGMVKGAFSKKARGVCQPGNAVHVHWQARLEEHLGHMQCELVQSITAQLLAAPLLLQLVNALTAMVITCVPERIPERDIYRRIHVIITAIHQGQADVNVLAKAYVEMEFTILQALGFGLDLRECAGMGKCPVEELIYVSPKSGKAVSREAGEPYKAKLLPLPAYLLHNADIPAELRQILDGLRLTGYFLEQWVLQPEGRKLPEARRTWVRSLERLLHAPAAHIQTG